MNRVLLLSLLLLLFFNVSYSFPLSGDIWGTWPADYGPYEVAGDLHIPQESTLVFEAGCYLDFQGRFALIVDTSAALIAVGNETDSITFTSTDTVTCWSGIRLLSECNGSEFAYCIIERSTGPDSLDDSEIIGGGAIYINNAVINVSNCTIRNNDLFQYSGAGIFCKYSEVNINTCSFVNNEAESGQGGGIFAYTSLLNIRNSVFLNNWGALGGGAIYATESSNITLKSNIFENNWSYYNLGGELGGPISIRFSEAIIEDNYIANNYSMECGGGLSVIGSTLTMRGNYVLNNQASFWGGGGFISSCKSATVSNNIIAYNENYRTGGGLWIYRCDSLTFTNNTICNNSSSSSGGGIYWYTNLYHTFANNIVYSNTSYDNSQIYVYDSTLTATYSCIEGGWEGEDNIDADPLFVDPDNYDFNLSWDSYPEEDQYKSPCIDTGDPNSPLDPDSSRADMGALPFNRDLVSIIDIANLPRMIDLSQNYPNPFNAATLIKYDLPQKSTVTIDIYDILGRKFSTLYDGDQPAGTHQVIWNASDVASGMYFYKLQAGDYSESKKMMLVK